MAEDNLVYTYVLRCNDDTWYTGWTVDLKHRLEAHNGLVPGGAKYTHGRRPVTLYWYQVFTDKREAQRLEYHFKKLSKLQKARYMKSHKSASLEELPRPEILQI